MIHTSRENEQYFLDTGYFPENLRKNVTAAAASGAGGGGGGGGRGGSKGASLSRIASSVCREFVKHQCMRGSSCKFYHPTPQELEVLLSQQGNMEITDQRMKVEPGGNSAPPPGPGPVDDTALKSRVNQLERLLADACYCMTLAVGDQNPAIATLMKTISDMAPESALANQTGDASGEGGATVDSAAQ